MRKSFTSILSTLLLTYLSLTTYSVLAAEEEPTSEEVELYQELMAFDASLNKQTGTVSLANGKIELVVPESFYFLSAEDSNKVLVDLWGNPPGEPVLGMLFPTKYSVVQAEAWGVTLEYEKTGYISDEEANDIDYFEMMADMKKDTNAWNQERVQQGYEPITLIGWADDPKYDSINKKLHWAKELQFGTDASIERTLNYNVRVLGRQGVLNMNFIAGMTQLEEIKTNITTVMDIANFKQGHTYAEFDSSIDEVAAYGIGALVAGKVAAKTGFLAILLVFLKKFWFIALAGLAWIGKLIFGKKNRDDDNNNSLS